MAGAAQHQTAGEKRVHGQAQAHKQAITKEEQHQDGHAAKKPDIKRGQPTQPRPAVNLAHGQRYPQHKPHAQRQGHIAQGNQAARQHGGQRIVNDQQ